MPTLVGLDPDPVGATLVLLEPVAPDRFLLHRWGLIRLPGEPTSHSWQMPLEEAAPLLEDAVVGIELITRLYKSSREEKPKLRATQQMGYRLLDLAEERARRVHTFPGRFRGNMGQAFFEGAWQTRLTGLLRPSLQDVTREVAQCVPNARHLLKNHHVLDAIGVALLAYRLAQREAA